MMTVYHIGSAPSAMPHAKVSDSNYYEQAHKECYVFINQIRRMFGNEPEGSRLFVKDLKITEEIIWFEVTYKFDTSIREHTTYYKRLETQVPEVWDDEAIKELSTC